MWLLIALYSSLKVLKAAGYPFNYSGTILRWCESSIPQFDDEGFVGGSCIFRFMFDISKNNNKALILILWPLFSMLHIMCLSIFDRVFRTHVGCSRIHDVVILNDSPPLDSQLHG